MSRRSASDDLFSAIAHPTRRAILDRLASGELPVLALARPFDITLGALSQHLKVLREAGLVDERRDGRQRFYRLNPDPIREIVEWAATFERFWTTRLDNLGATLRSRHESKSRTRAVLSTSHRGSVGGDDG